MAFFKVIDRPSEMFDYFYALNPMPGDTILDGATAKIERVHVASDDKVVVRESRKRRGRDVGDIRGAIRSQQIKQAL